LRNTESPAAQAKATPVMFPPEFPVVMEVKVELLAPPSPQLVFMLPLQLTTVMAATTALCRITVTV
jgi:hypothetical protein